MIGDGGWINSSRYSQLTRAREMDPEPLEDHRVRWRGDGRREVQETLQCQYPRITHADRVRAGDAMRTGGNVGLS
jgi:hypothetical protein